MFDKLLNQQITNFLTTASVLSPYQSAHKKGFSTQTALLYITDSIRADIDNGKIVILIQFDISKAFDSVNHEILLRKLYDIGFSDDAIKLIWSYLCNRSHSIIDNDGNSSPILSITSGIPQGSALAANLFNIYIDSLKDSLSACKEQYSIFADDTNIWLACEPKDIQNCIDSLSNECTLIDNKLISLGLNLNSRKTKAIIFGTPYILENLIVPSNIIIGNTKIEYSTSITLLGVTLSNDLSWNAHVSTICKKANFSLHRLYRIGPFLPSSIKLILVKALILPIFDYACVVYYDLSGYLATKLDKLLNRAIRYIFNLRRSSHITPYRWRTRLLSLPFRRKYYLISLFFRITNTKIPLYLHNIFKTAKTTKPASPRRTSRYNANSTKFIVPVAKSAYIYNSFRATSIREWFKIPPSIKSLSSSNSFNSAISNFFLREDFPTYFPTNL